MFSRLFYSLLCIFVSLAAWATSITFPFLVQNIDSFLRITYPLVAKRNNGKKEEVDILFWDV